MGVEGLRMRGILAAGFLASLPGWAHELGASRYDYVRHVRPVFERHCAACHRPGGPAPMSLLRYEEAAPWANAIKLMVLERRMPPWLPEEGLGVLRGTRGLPAPELDLLVEWASGGAPRGEGLDEGVGGAPKGSPESRADLVLPASRESVLGPEEVEKTECVSFPARLERDRVLEAVELRPENESIVRSAVFYHGDSCREEDRPLATWLPGDAAFEMPEGAGEMLRRGASLSARMLYRKTWALDGQAVRERSRLALRFAKGRPAALTHLNLEPGTSAVLPRAVRVVSVFPRGARGASLHLQATRPGRDRERLFAVERYDPDWRAKYVLSVPLSLEAGTRVEAVSGGFWIDHLPGDPVTAGPRRGAPAGTP